MNGNGLIVNLGRPASPADWQHTETRSNRKIKNYPEGISSALSIEMGWHHMMPWNTIRDGWNNLIVNEHWNVLDSWCKHLGFTDRIGPLLENAITRDDLKTSLCWSTWNIVEGPTNRTDDPGEEFDRFTAQKLPSNLRNRCLYIEQLFFELRKAEIDTKNVLKIFDNLKPYKKSPIHMFNFDEWNYTIRTRDLIEWRKITNIHL
jgi:hypothetical protein